LLFSTTPTTQGVDDEDNSRIPIGLYSLAT
jgi:hypothetical protein